VTDYDCWHESAGPVDISEILRVMRANVAKAQNTIANLALTLGGRGRRTCACGRALKDAIITDRNSIPAATRENLRPIIGKYL
jgi:5'-methylthioadenosine phosphorylase